MKLITEKRLNRLDVLVLATIILIGLVKLPQPFMGDQALSTIMASKMSRGEVIYRDLWDLKQPGIFGFYLVAGTLFGFNEIGVHTFELFYMTAFSVVLMLTLKGYYENRTVVSLTPLLTVGVYYGVCSTWHQTQTEALVGFPVFLSLWCAFRSSQPGGRQASWAFLSGFMGGVVLLFKIMFLPIVAVFWLTALLYVLIRGKERLQSALLLVIAPTVLGALLPIVIAIGFFVWHGVIDLVCWTYFVYPVRAMSEISSRIGVLVNGLSWFVSEFSVLIALGLGGAYTSLSHRKDFLTLNLTLWLILGFAITLIQRLSWWEYHYLLLLVPLGLLGARGLDVLWSYLTRSGLSLAPRRSRIVAGLCLVLLFLPTIGPLGKTALLLARDGFAFTEENRLRYQGRVDSYYQTVLQEVTFLTEPESLSGEIYVFGDVLYYYLSGRDPAVPLLATWFTSLPEMWVQLLHLLDEDPPPYVFVDANALDGVRDNTPRVCPNIDTTIRWVESNYEVLRRSETGTWYVLRER